MEEEEEEDVGWEMGSGGGGGGCSAVFHSEHVAAGQCQKHHRDTVKLCHPVFPRKQEINKPTKPCQERKQQGSVDGGQGRMQRVMLSMGHRMCFDHARLMLTLVPQYRGW